MDSIDIHIAVRSFVWKLTFHIYLDLIFVGSLFSSTPRVDALCLFISDILWLSEYSQSLKQYG